MNRIIQILRALLLAGALLLVLAAMWISILQARLNDFFSQPIERTEPIVLKVSLLLSLAFFLTMALITLLEGK